MFIWKHVRVVEGACLLSKYRFYENYPGFKSLCFRQIGVCSSMAKRLTVAQEVMGSILVPATNNNYILLRNS